MFVCVCVSLCVFMCVYVCVGVFMWVCVSVCYVCVCACVCMCVYGQTLKEERRHSRQLLGAEADVVLPAARAAKGTQRHAA